MEYLRQYCAARGYSVVDVLSDVASGLRTDRRGLMKLFDHVTKGEAETCNASSERIFTSVEMSISMTKMGRGTSLRMVTSRVRASHPRGQMLVLGVGTSTPQE